MIENRRERKENSFPSQCLVYYEGKKMFDQTITILSIYFIVNNLNVDNMVILHINELKIVFHPILEG